MNYEKESDINSGKIDFDENAPLMQLWKSESGIETIPKANIFDVFSVNPLLSELVNPDSAGLRINNLEEEYYLKFVNENGKIVPLIREAKWLKVVPKFENITDFDEVDIIVLNNEEPNISPLRYIGLSINDGTGCPPNIFIAEIDDIGVENAIRSWFTRKN